jgi:hypothetical protein
MTPEPTVENHEDVIWKHVNKVVIGIWLLLGLCSLPLGIISMLVGYFWTGPECVKAALKYGRSPNWAFVCGGFFNLIGWFVYWCYLKYRGDG